ncbi:unnamed protein product [Gadus morhua 'NCC']
MCPECFALSPPALSRSEETLWQEVVLNLNVLLNLTDSLYLSHPLSLALSPLAPSLLHVHPIQCRPAGQLAEAPLMYLTSAFCLLLLWLAVFLSFCSFFHYFFLPESPFVSCCPDAVWCSSELKALCSPDGVVGLFARRSAAKVEVQDDGDELETRPPRPRYLPPLCVVKAAYRSAL